MLCRIHADNIKAYKKNDKKANNSLKNIKTKNKKTKDV